MKLRSILHISGHRARTVVIYVCALSFVFVTFFDGVSHAAHGTSHNLAFHETAHSAVASERVDISGMADAHLPCHEQSKTAHTTRQQGDTDGDQDAKCMCCCFATCLTGLAPPASGVHFRRLSGVVQAGRAVALIPSPPWRLERPPKPIL